MLFAMYKMTNCSFFEKKMQCYLYLVISNALRSVFFIRKINNVRRIKLKLLFVLNTHKIISLF